MAAAIDIVRAGQLLLVSPLQVGCRGIKDYLPVLLSPWIAPPPPPFKASLSPPSMKGLPIILTSSQSAVCERSVRSGPVAVLVAGDQLLGESLFSLLCECLLTDRLSADFSAALPALVSAACEECVALDHFELLCRG